jgi:hypothetical protein
VLAVPSDTAAYTGSPYVNQLITFVYILGTDFVCSLLQRASLQVIRRELHLHSFTLVSFDGLKTFFYILGCVRDFIMLSADC